MRRAFLYLSLVLPLSAADDAVCARCHPAEVSTFRNSPMGRSIAAAPDLPALPNGNVNDGRADTRLTASRHGGRLIQTLNRAGLNASWEMTYAVGADAVGYTFLVQHGRYLFQSPLSWYRQKQGWDLTPGYESETTVDLEHPVTSGCLFCHTGQARTVSGTTNQFEAGAITAISCERCHGSTARHLASPVPGSILNPAKLSHPERDSVCEQCHLEGAVRVRNPGRDWWDFQPGNRQEDVYVTFVEARAERGVKAVSQVEQLADSQCARASGGRLWCGSCHNPHGEPATAATVRPVCMSCHETLFAAGRHRPEQECLSCHMPRLRADNVAHAAVTDHTIPRRPGGAVRQGVPTIRAWREPEPALRNRDTGLALVQFGASQRDATKVKAGYDLLAAWYETGGAHDTEALSALASVLLDSGDARLAARLFRTASVLEPRNAANLYGLAEALEKTGDRAGAIAELRRAIAADPSYVSAYLMLSGLYRAGGDKAMAASTLEEYLRFLPGSLRFRMLLR